MPNWKKVIVSGSNAVLNNITSSGNISASGDFTGNSFIKGGGTSAQFLKADGSVDSTAYTTNTGTVTEVTVGTGLDVSNGTTTPNITLDLTEVGFGGTAGNLVTDDGDGTVTSQDNLTFDSNTNTLSVLGIPRTSGYISASSDIVAGENIFAGGSGVFGGNVTATDIIVGDDVRLADNSKIISENTSTTYILLNNDDYWRINANNINVAQFSSGGVVVNENSAASCDFRVESNNDTHALFVDSGNDKVAIGTSTVGNSLLTIDGDVTATNITASGNISSSGTSTGSFGRVEANSFSKQICVTNHGFALDSNNSEPNYFPLNNLNETRTGDTAQYYARMIAPYDGKVVKVMVRADADIGNSCSVVLTKLSTSGQDPDGLRDEGTDVETVSGIDCSTLNTTYTFAFTNGAFSTGDVVNVGLQKNSTNTANVTAVVVWEYTL